MAVREKAQEVATRVGDEFPIDALTELIIWIVENCFTSAARFTAVAQDPSHYYQGCLYRRCRLAIRRAEDLRGRDLTARAHALANALLETAADMTTEELEALVA